MGKIGEKDGISISVPSGDHHPPHVHVSKAGKYMKVQIADYNENKGIVIKNQPTSPSNRLSNKDQKKAIKYIIDNWDDMLDGFKNAQHDC